MIKRVLRRLLPAAAYGMGKVAVQHYRARRQALEPKLGEDDVRRIFAEELGLVRGDIAFVHSSVDALNLNFSFIKLLGLLREAVGEEGTLLFPASQLTQRPEIWLAEGGIFDLKRSPTSMGLLAEWVRRQRSSQRSMHPTHSVVAQGPLATELVGEHHCAPAPCGIFSPYYKVVERGGVVLGLGVDADVMTMVHCVEDVCGEHFPVATRRPDLYLARVLNWEGAECAVETVINHPRIRFRRMLSYVERHIDEGICRRFRVGSIPFYRAEAGLLYARMWELAEQGVTIYWPSIHRHSPWEQMLSHLAEKLEER